MDVSCLFQPPANEAEIQERLTAAQEFFITVQAERLGVAIEDLRILLPETLMLERDSPDFIRNPSALGACNYSAYQLKLNLNALYEGAVAIEMIAFHEYTHIFDSLLIKNLLEPSDYRLRLKRFLIEQELNAYGKHYLLWACEHWGIVPRPQWTTFQLAEARKLLSEILETPTQFLVLKESGFPLCPAESLLEEIEVRELKCENFNFSQIGYYQALYVGYWFSETLQAEGMIEEHQDAVERLFEQIDERWFAWAERNIGLVTTFLIGNYNVGYGIGGLECKDYFDLPEPLQLSYLCSKGEIHARQEASRLLLMAIEQWTASNQPIGAFKRQLDGEMQTLKASIKLESLLYRWGLLRIRLPEAVFDASRQGQEIESKIQNLAVLSRTHKLIRRFYPSVDAYQFSRIWNEKRLLPLPQEWPQAGGLPELETALEELDFLSTEKRAERA